LRSQRAFENRGMNATDRLPLDDRRRSDDIVASQIARLDVDPETGETLRQPARSLMDVGNDPERRWTRSHSSQRVPDLCRHLR
jgi:hypothetical protein